MLRGGEESGDESEARDPFCILMRKPIDKIMICYGKVPSDFTSSFENYFISNHSVVQSPHQSSKVTEMAQASAEKLATLARHMHHKRWLWVTRDVVRDDTLLSTVLSALTKYALLQCLTQTHVRAHSLANAYLKDSALHTT